VAARFTLDAMPGKQMAIDADLNAGLIGEDDARLRRATIADEANFFGSMDGASKFVRGDAVAGILIMFINVVGGLFVGVLQHNLDLATAAKTYTLLAIGDGLVAQIPALIISTAAGMVVSRVSTDQDLGEQVMSQLFSKPQVLLLTGGIVGGMGLIPGMPHFAFLLLAGLLLGGAHMLKKAPPAEAATNVLPLAEATALSSQEASWDDVTPVDVLGLEVGYRLIQMVDKFQDGELLKRIMGIRKKFAHEIGFLPAPVHIRDNLEFKPNAYRITLKGVEIGSGEAQPGMMLAINPGRVMGVIPGISTQDPAFGLPAVWIDPALREQAQSLGYTVADPSTVVATHLNHLIQTHAAELLGRHEVQQLLDHLAKSAPKLVEDVVPKMLPLSTLQKVLHNLLEEAVHIRDMRTIIETLADNATQTQDPALLTSAVRIALGRAITQQLFPSVSEMQVVALNPGLERLLLQAMQSDSSGSAGIEPGLADTLMRETASAAEHQEQLGLPPVMLVPAQLRTQLSRFLRRTVPQLKVLSHAEIPDSRKIRVAMMIGSGA
jgi:flagellar biosynthesis protein FlhA